MRKIKEFQVEAQNSNKSDENQWKLIKIRLYLYFNT